MVPVPSRQKRPSLPRWEDLRLTEADLPDHFGGWGGNIGLLVGEPSGGLVDVDLDCPEALALADWLPPTALVAGRPGNPGSHRFYQAAGATTTKFQTAREMLIELRSTGGQTLAPPSVHPSGEAYRWERAGRAAEVDADELLRAVARVAAGALIARHWPAEGGRHDAALALAGMLLRGDWGAEEAAEFVRGVARAAGDEEWQARGADVATTARRIADGEPATGAPRLAEALRAGARVVALARRWLGLREVPATADDAPEGWPAPPDAAAFHGLAGDVVRALEPHTEADPVALLVNLLAMFGSAAGRGPHATVSGQRHGVNLFAVLVGATATGRKGTSEAGPRALFARADPLWSGDRLGSGLSSGEGLIHAVRDERVKREPIRERGTQRVTGYQEVLEDEGVDDKRLLVIEGEFAQALKVLGREGNTLSPVIREAWDGKSLRVMTRNSPAKATDLHIGILGHITRRELLQTLGEGDLSNGLANRFLWCCVRRSKLLPEGGWPTEAELGALADRLEEALEFARGCGELRRDDAARARWAALYPTLSEGEESVVGEVTARGAAQVLRLSLIYALLDRSAVVRVDHLDAAHALWRYCAASARHIFGGRAGDRVADRILQALREGGPLGRTEIAGLFGRNERADRLDRTLDGLVDAGQVRRERDAGTGGRPRDVFVAA